MNKEMEMENISDNAQLKDLLNSLKDNEYHKFESIVKGILLNDEASCSHWEECGLIALIKEFKKRHEKTLTHIINHLYGPPENKTLLDLSCSYMNRAHYVKILLELGADVNQINDCYGAAPIHFAVLHSDLDTFKLLINYENTDIYLPNATGKTAFHLAVQEKRTEFTKLLEERQISNKEKVEHEGRLTKKHSPFQEGLQASFGDNINNLGILIKMNDYKKFECYANNDDIHHVNYEGLTFLQYACKFGRTKFVKYLLTFNVDPNKTTDSEKLTPIIIAASRGYYDIVQLLINTGKIKYDLIDKENILHFIMNRLSFSMAMKHLMDTDDDDNKSQANHAKCLELILSNIPIDKLDVNLKDSEGNTPLFLASVLDEQDIIRQLIEKDADIGIQGWSSNDKAPIKCIQPATLEYFLDISTTTTSINKVPLTLKNNYPQWQFNYSLLTCNRQYLDQNGINETKALEDISETSELKPLLQHPFFLVYLDFKWHIIMKKVFYINLIFFIELVVSLSIYLLIFDYAAAGNNANTFWYVVLINNCIMVLREFTPLIIYTDINKYKYIKDPTNWIEIIQILITFIILFGKIQSIQNRALLAATDIFFSYVALMFLILSHPRISVYIKMFKTVTLNSFEFLISYLPFILAFAFSFYILFKDYTNSKDINWKGTNSTETNSKNITSDYKPFENKLQAIFKTIIMLMGEYDLSDILNDDEYGIRHLIFIIFIFLMPIVLLNLLNAIAVNDIQSIRKDAELVSTIARIKLIAHMEEMISFLFSFLVRLDKYYMYKILVRREWRRRILGKRYYYTNFFSPINNDKIIDLYDQRSCLVRNHDGSDFLNFNISPSTERSLNTHIKLSAAANKKEKVNPYCTTTKSTEKISTLHEVCQNLRILKNVLAETDEEYTNEEHNEVQQILREILVSSMERQRGQQWPTSSKGPGKMMFRNSRFRFAEEQKFREKMSKREPGLARRCIKYLYI